MRGSDILSKAKSPGGAAPASRSAERFRLAGPTQAVDRRINAVRNDIADVALAGRLFAPHYACPVERRCTMGTVIMTAGPSACSAAVSELRLGDGFALLDESGGWAWGYSLDDHYVGYVPAASLGQPQPATHSISARAALVFAAADIKAPVTATLPMGARVTGAWAGDFLHIDAGFLHRRHVRAIGETLDDPASVATSLLGTPYRWGGRSSFGIDCSGLVQLALAQIGIAAPRDSDQQRDRLGEGIADGESLRRNDIVFFPGHVGIMLDEHRIIHANAHAMAVSIEALSDVVARGAEIVARRKLAL